MASPPARVLAELYAVPPGAFTRERNAKAAALAKAGKADEARAVKQLRRPSAVLWAVNQLARVAAKELAAFLDAAQRLRATQLRDPRAAAEMVQQHRAHLGALVQRTRDVLRGEEYQLSPAIERRISDTLLGAAADRRLADDLRAGGLAAEVQAPGFDALMGAPGVGKPAARSKSTRTMPSTAAETPSNADVERARLRAQALAREAATREAAAREAATREAAAQQLEREIAAAAGALTEQRRRLRDARREARRAAAAVQRAGRKAPRRK